MSESGEKEAELRAIDPKGLIREAYRIEGIGEAECRSILVDWALSLGGEHDPAATLAVLHRAYGAGAPDHPMTALLLAGQQNPQRTGRRGGYRGRRH